MILGFRCSNSDITYAVLDGTREAPTIVAVETLSTPKGFTRRRCLRWVLNEADVLIKRHSVVRVVLKKHEGRQASSAYEHRVEHEAAIMIASEDNGLEPCVKKGKSTIAKDLGLKGKGQYLATKLDTSPIDGFDGLSSKKQEAVQIAWSSL